MGTEAGRILQAASMCPIHQATARERVPAETMLAPAPTGASVLGAAERTQTGREGQEEGKAMRKLQALDDINRSMPSIEAPGTLISGFANRLVRQYGAKAVLWAVEQSRLSTIQVGWVKRWIQDNAKAVRR